MSGLVKGKYDQVFMKKRNLSPRLFNVDSVEAINCIKQVIGVIECEVRNASNSSNLSKRVYFVNSITRKLVLLSGVSWASKEIVQLIGI